MGSLRRACRAYRRTAQSRSLRLLLGLVIAATLGATAGTARIGSAAASPGEPVVGAGVVQLSDERTLTRWAYVMRGAGIHVGPDSHSPRIARLHFLTEDDFPEVYLALLAERDTQGTEWVKVRLPGRPNGRVGWVRRDALGSFHTTDQLLVVDRERLRIYLYAGGRLRWSAPVAIGKPASPTPAGHYWIREWFKIRDRSSGYWPYALGTAAYSRLTDWPGGGVVGIHGPYYQPRQIPGRLSHGCIRLRAKDDGWLGRQVGIGVPLDIV